jgi:hypothetical protein
MEACVWSNWPRSSVIQWKEDDHLFEPGDCREAGYPLHAAFAGSQHFAAICLLGKMMGELAP